MDGSTINTVSIVETKAMITKRSLELQQLSNTVIPGGVNSPVRAFGAVGIVALAMPQGSRVEAGAAEVPVSTPALGVDRNAGAMPSYFGLAEVARPPRNYARYLDIGRRCGTGG